MRTRMRLRRLLAHGRVFKAVPENVFEMVLGGAFEKVLADFLAEVPAAVLEEAL